MKLNQVPPPPPPVRFGQLSQTVREQPGPLRRGGAERRLGGGAVGPPPTARPGPPPRAGAEPPQLRAGPAGRREKRQPPAPGRSAKPGSRGRRLVPSTGLRHEEGSGGPLSWPCGFGWPPAQKARRVAGAPRCLRRQPQGTPTASRGRHEESQSRTRETRTPGLRRAHVSTAGRVMPSSSEFKAAHLCFASYVHIFVYLCTPVVGTDNFPLQKVLWSC